MTNLTNDRESDTLVRRPLRRLFIGLTLVLLFGLFLFWRMDSDRVRTIRAELVDWILPAFELGIRPGRFIAGLIDDFGAYSSVVDRISELEEENRQLRQYRERATLLEQQNAKLREISNVQLARELSTIAAQVTADTSGAFRNSVLINVGRRNGIADGWAVVDGGGLVGRVSGVSRTSSRVILVSDANSRIPAKIKPSGSRAIVAGRNSSVPHLELISNLNQVRPGDMVLTSGEGGIFPPDLLIGTVVVDQDNRVRTRLAADLGDLEFVTIVRSRPPESVDASSDLLVAPADDQQGAAALR